MSADDHSLEAILSTSPPPGHPADRVHTTFLVPVFNGARYLSEALASIQAQHARGWVGLIVDDGSTDNSWEIVEDFLRDHPGPAWRACRHPTNRGLYPRLNEALASITTDWVAIVMQDDTVEPTYLSEMRRIALTHPEAEAIWATNLTVDANGSVIARGIDSARVEVIPAGVAPWESALVRGCFWGIFGSYSRVACLRGTAFREDLPHCGDYEWLLRALRRHTLVYLESPLSRIRVHAGAASARNLPAGIDLAEHYAILLESFAPPCPPLRWRARTVIAHHWSYLALRRAAGAASRSEGRHAAHLAALALRFAVLPLRPRRTGPPRPRDPRPGWRA